MKMFIDMSVGCWFVQLSMALLFVASGDAAPQLGHLLSHLIGGGHGGGHGGYGGGHGGIYKKHLLIFFFLLINSNANFSGYGGGYGGYGGGI